MTSLKLEVDGKPAANAWHADRQTGSKRNTTGGPQDGRHSGRYVAAKTNHGVQIAVDGPG